MAASQLWSSCRPCQGVHLCERLPGFLGDLVSDWWDSSRFRAVRLSLSCAPHSWTFSCLPHPWGCLWRDVCYRPVQFWVQPWMSQKYINNKKYVAVSYKCSLKTCVMVSASIFYSSHLCGISALVELKPESVIENCVLQRTQCNTMKTSYIILKHYFQTHTEVSICCI